MKLNAKTVSVFMTAAVAVAALTLSSANLTFAKPRNEMASDNTAVQRLRETGEAFASVTRDVSPSVVMVQVEGSKKAQGMMPFNGPFGDEFFKRFFGQQFPGMPGPQGEGSEQKFQSQGSGFVYRTSSGLIHDKSWIMTNNHVVEGADSIRVKFQDGSEFDARTVGNDPKSDIAILEINDATHKALPIADSSSLEVGEWVLALGNPFGLSHTLTVGVVSAKGRSGLGINDYEDFIQTDAAINPGNSGGPLLNLDGEVVGINTAIFSRSGGYMGIGFAIPVNQATAIANQLIDSGKVTRGFLGIVIQPLTPDLAESFKIDRNKGILVSQVSKDSPAYKGGIRTGDVIIEYQGQKVEEIADFRNHVAMTAPGEKASITVLREGAKKNLQVKVGELSDDKVKVASAEGDEEVLGISVEDLNPELAQQYHVEENEGVLVTAVDSGSVAARAGISPGTVILQANRKPVHNTDDIKTAVENSKDDKRLLLLISKDGNSRFLLLNWG